ncbi:LrgB family protein [Serratia sp. AKBS12]|uniref:LrgB family protein n=1 Tax=Serratia sp. AKBS12 TaxID=2974597 RepID=UPI0021668C43|nr:LrgB family protein [Serratia sp. AKBS12]MCS3406889.1 LrgB family protein [Serratia sp. AKBS12]
MNDFFVSVICFAATLALYYVNKTLYRRRRTLLLMPLVLTPMVLVVMLVVTHVSYQDYISETHWLLWLLGPATIAFAVPVYENLHIIRRHWLSLGVGVVTAVLVAVYSSVWLAQLLTLPEEVQRSLAVRSITTPFALEAARQMGGQPDLVALFVVITGVFGMAIGEILFLRLAVRSRLAKGAGLGASSHGAGTARAYEMGEEEGVVSSLVMMLAGIITVVAAPLIGQLMW